MGRSSSALEGRSQWETIFVWADGFETAVGSVLFLIYNKKLLFCVISWPYAKARGQSIIKEWRIVYLSEFVGVLCFFIRQGKLTRWKQILLDSCLYHKKGAFSVFPEKYGFQTRQEWTELLGSEVLKNSISQTYTLFYAVLVGGHTKRFSCMENRQVTREKTKNIRMFSLYAITADFSDVLS